ncbi:MAG: hypothetical protein FJW88_12260 [Actinobacteria bacterium]|nr:hypothetical protein [Actinomycetota bacterium]
MTDAGPPAVSPPAAEPYGWTPPAAPTRPRARLGWLAIAIPMVVLIVAGGILAVVLGVGKLTEPIDVTNDFLAALRDERWTDAYDLLCERERVPQSPADFARDLEQYGPVTAYDFKSSEITNSRATTEGTIELDGVENDARVHLRREDGAWKVCNIDLGR